MKWIGQQTYDQISRFRDDVYLETVSTSTETDMLVVDSAGKITKRAMPLVSLTDGADNRVVTATGTDSLLAETYLTFQNTGNISTLSILSDQDTGDKFTIATTTLGATTIRTDDDDESNASHLEFLVAGDISFHPFAGGFNIQSEVLNKPLIEIKSTNTARASGGEIKFLKDASNVVDGEQLGRVSFYGDNDAGTPEVIQYAEIIGVISDMTDGQEAGDLYFKVAAYDGVLTNGLHLNGDTNADGEVDVTIGTGAASTTTIAGTLTMGSTAALNNTGILQTAAQTNITSLGTLTALDVDDINLNGKTITITGDTDDTFSIVTGAAGATTLTTVDDNAAAGHFEIAADGNIILDAAGDIALEADTTISGDLLVTSGTAGDCVVVISADTDNSEEGDSPKLWFKADGDIIQGAIQHKDNTFDFISNVSANGGFRFLTGTTNNTGTTDPENGATERMSIADDGVITLANLVCTAAATFGGGYGSTGATISTAGVGTFNGALTTDGAFTCASRTLALSSATDGDHDGDVVYFGGTTSMTIGKIYHYKSDGTWEIVNADAVATSDGLLAVALGAASDTNGMLLRGMVTLDHDPGAIGDVLYVQSDNAGVPGNATATAPSVSGDCVRIIGYQVSHASNGNIWFNPDSTFVEVA